MQVAVIFLTVLASLAVAAPQQGGYDYSAPQAGSVTGAFPGTRQQPTGGAGTRVSQQQGTAAQSPGFVQTTGFPQDGSRNSFGAEIAHGPVGTGLADSPSGGRTSAEKFQVSSGSGEVGFDNSQLSGTQVGRPLAAASGSFGATSSDQGIDFRGLGPTGSQHGAFSTGGGEASFVGFSGQGSQEIGVAGQQTQGAQYGGQTSGSLEQRPEIGSVGAQRGQISGQVAGVQGQTFGTQGQGTGIHSQGTGIQSLGAGIRDQGTGVHDQGTGIHDQGDGIQDQGILIQDQAAGFFGQGAGSGGQGHFDDGGQRIQSGFDTRGEQVSQAGQQLSGVGQSVAGQGPGISGQGFQEGIGGFQSTGGAAGTAIGVRGGQPPAPFVDDLAVPAEYNFKWDVTDPESGNFYGHEEERNGANTRGRYYVTLPDTRVMTVEYYADETGYHPTITYEGEAQVFETVRQQGGGQQAAVTGQATQREQQNQFLSQGSDQGFPGQAGGFQGQEQTVGFQGQTGDFQSSSGEFAVQREGGFEGQPQTGAGFEGQRQTSAGFTGQAQTGEFLEQEQTGAGYQEPAETGGFQTEGQTGDGFQGQAQAGGFQGQELTGPGPGQGAVSEFLGQGVASGFHGQEAFNGVQSQGVTGTLQGQGIGFGSGSHETGIGDFRGPQQVGSFQSSGEFIDSSAGFPSTGFSGKPFQAGSSAEISALGDITTFGSGAPSSGLVQPSPSAIQVPGLASVAASGYTAPVNRETGLPTLATTLTSAGTGAFPQQNDGVPLPGPQSQTSLEGQQQFGLQPQQQFTGSAASQEQFGNFQPSLAQQQQPGIHTSQQSTSGFLTTHQQQPAFPVTQQQSSPLQSARQPQGQLPFGFQSNQQTPVSQDRTVEQPSLLYQAPDDQPGVNRLTQQAGTGQNNQQQPNLFQQQQTLQSAGFSGEQTGSQFTPQQSSSFQQQQGVQNIASSAEQSGFPQQPNTFIQQQGVLNIGSNIEQGGSQLTQPGSFQQQQGLQSVGSSGELSASQFAQQQPGPFPQQQALQSVLSGGQSIEQEYQEPTVQNFGSQSFQSGQGQAIQNQQTGGTVGVPSGLPHTSGQRFQNQLSDGSSVQSSSGEVGSAVSRIPQRPSQLYGPPQG